MKVWGNEVIFDADLIGPWVCEKTGGTWIKGRGTAIGKLNQNGDLVAGVLYEDWNKAKYKIGAIEPQGYTRIGAALRHSGAMLDKRSTKNKWVILISDGKPNDFDKYEGKYGINDVRQALRELHERQIKSYALAIEKEAKYYLPQMFGQGNHQILTTPRELLQSMVKLYEKIKNQS